MTATGSLHGFGLRHPVLGLHGKADDRRGSGGDDTDGGFQLASRIGQQVVGIRPGLTDLAGVAARLQTDAFRSLQPHDGGDPLRSDEDSLELGGQGKPSPRARTRRETSCPWVMIVLLIVG